MSLIAANIPGPTCLWLNLAILFIWLTILAGQYAFAVYATRSFMSGRSVRALITSVVLYLCYVPGTRLMQMDLESMTVPLTSFLDSDIRVIAPLLLLWAIVMYLEVRLGRMRPGDKMGTVS